MTFHRTSLSSKARMNILLGGVSTSRFVKNHKYPPANRSILGVQPQRVVTFSVQEQILHFFNQVQLRRKQPTYFTLTPYIHTLGKKGRDTDEVSYM